MRVAKMRRLVFMLLLITAIGGYRLKSNNSGFQLAEGIEVNSLEGISEGNSEHWTGEGYYIFTLGYARADEARRLLLCRNKRRLEKPKQPIQAKVFE